jgi:predicted RNase H-like HicB family nuclease
MHATFTLVMVRERDGRYSVSVPALKGCHTWGNDLAHALHAAEEAIRGFANSMQKHGEALPADVEVFSGSLGEATEALVLKVAVSLEETAESLAV